MFGRNRARWPGNAVAWTMRSREVQVTIAACQKKLAFWLNCQRWTG